MNTMLNNVKPELTAISTRHSKSAEMIAEMAQGSAEFVLDYGCGTGRNMNYLLSSGIISCGCDRQGAGQRTGNEKIGDAGEINRIAKIKMVHTKREEHLGVFSFFRTFYLGGSAVKQQKKNKVMRWSRSRGAASARHSVRSSSSRSSGSARTSRARSPAWWSARRPALSGSSCSPTMRGRMRFSGSTSSRRASSSRS